MTRFWITLQQGVQFVLKSFERLQGGETFVPKIPSIRITDLVKAMAPEAGVRVIGIRPGEKLHEVMCPLDDSRLTLEFADHFVIKPAINFLSPIAYSPNPLGERAEPVSEGFDYNSGRNPWFLSVPEISAMNEETA